MILDTRTRVAIDGAIGDDLAILQASAGVLHLAYADLAEGHAQGESALAKSLWFTARNIEAACERIEQTLHRDEPDTDPPCTCHREALP